MSCTCRAFTTERVGRVEDAQLEKLSRVVPLVERVAHVEAFVALKANQIGVEHGGHRGGEGGLADTRLAFDEQRPFQAQGEKHRDREPGIRHVVLGGEALLEVGDGRRRSDDGPV